MSLIGHDLLHYRVLEEIGRGGMGVVYQAEDTELDRQVAIKVLAPELTADPENVARLRREARTLAGLNHPSIVTIHSVGETGGMVFLVMERVEGQVVSSLIPPGGLPLQRLYRIAVPLADALSAAHERGIVHRDVKPGNVMVTAEGRVKVLDFGLARHEPAGASWGLESTATFRDLGGLTGTVPYMSPEQLSGEPADRRSDIYSLGVTLFEMATGTRPFVGDSPAELIGSILRDSPRPLAEIRPALPPALTRIIHHCLRRDPDHRVQSVRDLCLVLEDLEKELASMGNVPARTHRAFSRRARAAALAGLLAGSAGIGLVVWQSRQGDTPASPASPATSIEGRMDRPHYLLVRITRTLAGNPGPDPYRHGILDLLERRFRAVDRLYPVPDTASPEPDFELGVDARSDGERVSLVYGVVAHRTGSRLGSDALDGSRHALWELLDTICASVVDDLRREAGVRARCRSRPPPTVDPEALDHYLRGRGAFGNSGAPGDPAAASAALRRAIDADPGFALAHADLGAALLEESRRSGDRELVAAARAACLEASRRDPALETAQVCLGDVLLEERRVLDASSAYRRAIELGDATAETFRKLVRCFSDLGRPDSAEGAWRQIIRTAPDLWLGYSSLGRLYTDSSRMDLAIPLYEQALRLSPRNRELDMGMFAARFYLGRWEEAIQALEESIAISPDYRTLSNLGHVYFLVRRFDEAVAAFERAVRDPRADYRAFGYLGRAYYWAPGYRGQAGPALEKAVEMCRSVLGSEPRNPGALINLASYEAMLGREAESREALRMALEQRPAYAHFEYLAGQVHNLLGEDSLALDYLGRAVRGGYPTAELRTTVELDNLRGEPRFQTLLQGGRAPSQPELLTNGRSERP